MKRTFPEDYPDLLAWVGQDELGSGQIGIKQARVPAGVVPIVVVDYHRDRATRPDIVAAMQQQANQYGKTIRLVRFVAVQEEIVLEPRK